ncbi:MAG: hypothetical protein M1587_07290, partial [Thaumarchaeota archaeon]|nr:hypothetical protein [Nitrososphaerota archaeon]
LEDSTPVLCRNVIFSMLVDRIGHVLRGELGIGRTALVGIIAAIIVIILGAGVALSMTNTTTSLTASSTTSSSSTSFSSTSINLQSESDLESGRAFCTSVDGLPDPTCTPGATNSNVTQDNIYSTICVSGWTSTVRPPTSYTNPLKIASIQDYRYNDTLLSDYEEDHLIPLELGGNPASVYNLWAQPHEASYNSYQKDALENYLKSQVCDGKLQLAQAQTEIATNWVQYWQIYKNSSGSSSATTFAASGNTTQSVSVQITYAQNPIVRGNTQVVYIATNPAIPNSQVNVTITYASGYEKSFTTISDSSGKSSVSWTIGSNSDPGTFLVLVKVDGGLYSSSFQVNS